MGEAIRAAALGGGAALLIRQGVGAVGGFLGLIVITACIGPEAYGAYAAALALALVAGVVAQGGMVQTLVRHPEPLDHTVAGAALALVLVQGGTVLLAASLLAPWLLPDSLPEAPAIAQSLLAVQALTVLAQLPLARLERSLAYRRIAITEGVAQGLGLVVGVTTAVLLADGPRAAWAPAAGWMVQHAVAALAWWWGSGSLPRPTWRGIGTLLRANATMSAAVATSQARWTILPLVAGHLLTPAHLGAVALAQRLVESVSIPRQVVWRVGTAALARLAPDPEAVRATIADGALLAAVGTGILLAGLSLVGLPLSELLLGERWALVATAVPAFAAGSLAGAVATLPSAALHQAGRSLEVVAYHLLLLALVAGTAVLLVPVWGVAGYLMAELVGIAAHGVAVWRARRAWGPLGVGPATGAAVVWSLAVAAGPGSAMLAVPALVWSVWPGRWAQVTGLIRRRGLPA